jgi:hypothetical protein
MNSNTTVTLSKYDTTTPTIIKSKKKEGELSKMPKMPRNNHVITCKIYKNIVLFTGDTYTYRGIFKRNSGDFNTKFRGYLVPLENIQSIRSEIYPQVQGYLVYHENVDLPIQTELIAQKTNVSKPTIQNVNMSDDDDY